MWKIVKQVNKWSKVSVIYIYRERERERKRERGTTSTIFSNQLIGG